MVSSVGSGSNASSIQTQARIREAFARLSSGLRINSAGDDPAMLAISEGFESIARSLGQATQNTLQGVSMVRTADGGLNSTTNVLQRMKELGVQASNSTLTADQRGAIQTEIDQLSAHLDQVSGSTSFNNKPLLDGTAGTQQFQTGPNAGDTLSFTPPDVSAAALGVSGGSVATVADAQALQNSVDNALTQVTGARAQIGAIENRMASTVDNLQVTFENTTASLSQMRDADIAKESSSLAAQLILQQAQVAMQAQANRAKKSASRLIS